MASAHYSFWVDAMSIVCMLVEIGTTGTWVGHLLCSLTRVSVATECGFLECLNVIGVPLVPDLPFDVHNRGDGLREVVVRGVREKSFAAGSVKSVLGVHGIQVSKL